ncbi:MAG TPA: cell division protein ZapD [Sedimenticola sp.]|nr:cell division protein ZapD [Sedimenticola sp.]
MSDLIIYEHPLNERIRTLLRLEHLFERIAFHMPRPETWSSRAAINGLLDIINILTRADIKSEVIKELERHSASLDRIRAAPGIDMQRLGSILKELEINTARLRQLNGQIGRNLRENDFLNGIMQRSGIPGGNCAFDLPHYHYWLRQPHDRRLEDLRRWFCELEPLQMATRLLLTLTRDCAGATRVQASGGMFQHTLESQAPAQLIRVGLPRESGLFPEISGGKHRFTIRFLEPEEIGRPAQTQQDVEFSLTCCIF